MNEPEAKQLNPTSFLQAFIVQSIRIAEANNGEHVAGSVDHVEKVGLATGGCLEAVARRRLGFEGSIEADQYAALILDIKNLIGGEFRQVPGEAGSIRVVNHRCPFGDLVQEAPELCRMTSSVFGAIAARNFGYAKVELNKRIASKDGLCDVRVYLDPEVASRHTGDVYRCEGGEVTARTANSVVTGRLEEMLCKAWCPPSDGGKWQQSQRRRIVAESAAMRRALQAVEVVAPTTASVLITGETGVGKEVIARAVHAMSQRADRIFLAVNCGAIPENLVESALFGHEKGAFTDAYQAREGFFERTDGGTLFLDEVDCLPLPAQARLLRVLQEGEYERVGGRQTRFTDARIVAAANSNLEQLVEAGRFRRDLYYRINVVPIHIPPLRERPDDVSALVSHFLKLLAEKYPGPRKALSERAWASVLGYAWPGNLRELENVLERSYLFARGSIIDEIAVNGESRQADEMNNLREAKKRASMGVESRVIKDTLSRTRGNVSAVARQLGITPRAVHMKLRKHGIDASSYRAQT